MVVRLVKCCQRGKQAAGKPVGGRFYPAKLQREQQKTADGHRLCGQQLGDIAVLLPYVAAEEKGQCIQSIERPIRHNGPCPKRDAVFPGKGNFRYAAALSGKPVGKTVGRVKNGADGQKFEQGGLERRFHRAIWCGWRPSENGCGKRRKIPDVISDGLYGFEHTGFYFFTAKLTVKIPSSSIH